MPVEFVRKPKWLPGAAFVALGVGLLIASLVVRQGTREFLSHAKVANGSVVDASKGGNHPLIEFSLANGEKMTFATGGFISGYTVGRSVRVFYEESAPLASARLDDPGALWFGAGVTAALGAGQLLLGLLAMFARMKDPKEG